MNQQVWQWLAEVPDPEIPVVSVVDLGIIRDVTIADDRVEVSVAPTYSGCPATDLIEQQIISSLEQHGLTRVTVKRVLSPPWTTDWISAEGRAKLLEYGIAPPIGSPSKPVTGSVLVVQCPRCRSAATELVSQFGSTACKATYKCCDCLEPFEYFKCL
jgi:ring-1,2-phenylacetyl-CoA epoxidase subunit PaaD